MKAQSQAKRGYSAASTTTRTFKQVEYEALALITHRMQKAAAEEQSGFPDLVQALHENRRLWSVFAIEVSNEANPLPTELRARLFYLSEFIVQHSRKVLAREEPVSPLIDINMSIMRGLRGGAS